MSTALDFITKYNEKKEKVIKEPIPSRSLSAPLVSVNKKGEVGLELEIEASRMPTEGDCATIIAPSTKAVWRGKADGSLRGENLEYVLSRPIMASEVPHMIHGLYDKFSSHRMRWNLSNRCSTHVHVNMGGKKINELTSIIALWTTLEDILVRWCGEERTSNHFCLTARDTDVNIVAWNNLLTKGNLSLPDGCKYTALNLKTLLRFGSFEFRTMRASEKPEPIVDWAKFVHGLCSYASNNYQNPQFLANSLSEIGGQQIFVDICRSAGVSDKFIEEVFELSPNFHAETMEGFRRAQSLVQGFPWYNWMETINKKHIPDPFSKTRAASWFTIEEPDNAPMPRRARAVPAEPAVHPDEDGPELAAIIDAVRDRNWEQIGGARVEPRPRFQNLGTRTFTSGIPLNQPLPRNHINPDLPIEFVDGSPAEIVGVRGNNVEVRSLYENLHRTEFGGVDLRNRYLYERSTGWFEGSAHVAQIRNVADNF